MPECSILHNLLDMRLGQQILNTVQKRAILGTFWGWENWLIFENIQEKTQLNEKTKNSRQKLKVSAKLKTQFAEIA